MVNIHKIFRDILIIVFLVFCVWLAFKLLGYVFRIFWVLLLVIIGVYILIRLGVLKKFWK